MEHVHAEIRRIESRLAAYPDPFQHAVFTRRNRRSRGHCNQTRLHHLLLPSWAARKPQS